MRPPLSPELWPLFLTHPPEPVAHSAPHVALQHPYLHTYGTACSLPVSRYSQLARGGRPLGSSLNPPHARRRISAQIFTEETTLKSVANMIYMKFLKLSYFGPAVTFHDRLTTVEGPSTWSPPRQHWRVCPQRALA